MSQHNKLISEDINFSDSQVEDEEAVAPQYKSLDDISRAHVSKVLEDFDWNMKKVIEILDIPRSSLYKKIKAWNLSKK